MLLEAKALELRDDMTCIAVIAIRMQTDDRNRNVIRTKQEPETIEAKEWLIHSRSGYPQDGSGIVLMTLGDQRANIDPYNWGGNRTIGRCHHYIREHFDELTDGQVIDYRVLVGEAQEPVISDRLAEMGRG